MADIARLLILWLSILVSTGLCSQLPFLVWSSEEIPDIDLSQPDVERILKNINLLIKDKDIVVLVTQDSLTFNDISLYGGVYEEESLLPKMKGLSETEHYASFAAGMHLDGILENGMWKDGFNIHKKWDETGRCVEEKSAFITNIPEGESVLKTLQFSDESIGKQFKFWKNCGLSFVLIFTTSSPPPEHVIRRREVAGASEDGNTTASSILVGLADQKSNNTICAMLLGTITISSNGTAGEEFVEKASSVNGFCGTCLPSTNSTNDTSTWISFNVMTNNSQTYKFSFKFPCNGRQEWSIHMNFTHDKDMEVMEMVTPKESKLSISNKVSFHCTRNVNFTTADKNSTMKYSILIDNFQVQPYSLQTSQSNLQFSIAYDCTPYFSMPFWMGVFTLTPILLVLYCSLIFLFQTESMDRFDDPRKKTITVETTH